MLASDSMAKITSVTTIGDSEDLAAPLELNFTNLPSTVKEYEDSINRLPQEAQPGSIQKDLTAWPFDSLLWINGK